MIKFKLSQATKKHINKLLASSWNSTEFWKLSHEAFQTLQMCQHECVWHNSLTDLHTATNTTTRTNYYWTVQTEKTPTSCHSAYRLRMNAFVSVDLVLRMHVTLCMYVHFHLPCTVRKKIPIVGLKLSTYQFVCFHIYT